MSAPGDPYDEIAVSIVCDERVPMRLTGADRLEAVRRLTARGVMASEIARLCMVSGHTITNLQHTHGIVPAAHTRSWWWCAFLGEHAA